MQYVASDDNNETVVAFKEIIERLASLEYLRLRQPRVLAVSYAGAEASVAAAICNFGGTACFVTALPKHSLAEAEEGDGDNDHEDTRRPDRSYNRPGR